MTVFHNGVLVQNDFVLKGVTLHTGKPFYKAHGPEPIKLQAHGDPSPPISFRNIWVRPLPPEPGGLEPDRRLGPGDGRAGARRPRLSGDLDPHRGLAYMTRDLSKGGARLRAARFSRRRFPMGGLSPFHWIIIVAVALIVFGGRGKLSSLMGDAAKGIKAFKEGLKDEEPKAEANAAARRAAARRGREGKGQELT